MDTMEWIKELCPEIAEWQAELIAEHIEGHVAVEREACARVCEAFINGSAGLVDNTAQVCAEAIRARGGE